MSLGRARSIDLKLIIRGLPFVHEVINNRGIVINYLLVVMDFVLFKHLFMKRVFIKSLFYIIEETIITLIISAKRLVSWTTLIHLALRYKRR
jgi:hypothetical protein